MTCPIVQGAAKLPAFLACARKLCGHGPPGEKSETQGQASHKSQDSGPVVGGWLLSEQSDSWQCTNVKAGHGYFHICDAHTS
jgi:hypothetical protein